MNKLGISKIEVLVVALIIGILGLVAVFSIMSARSQTRDAVRLSDIRQLQAGVELYFNDFNQYPEWPEYFAIGRPNTRCLGESGFASGCAPDVETVYLDVVPAPPKAGLSGEAACGNVTNAYCYIGNNGEYRIEFELENNNALLELEKGLNCAGEFGLLAGACPPLETLEEQQ